MKKVLAILMILHLCLIWSCIQQPQQENQEEKSVVLIRVDDSLADSKTPFNKSLMDEIHNCISDTNHRMQSQIYDLWFAKTDGDCCFAISTANFYHSRVAEGFYLIDDKLIVYYGKDVTCGAIMEGRINSFMDRANKVECSITCLIDSTLLRKDCPGDYPDENSEQALYTQFDPYGKIYKVHNCDSLELIYQGCL